MKRTKRFLMWFFCINRMRRYLEKRCKQVMELPVDHPFTIFNGSSGSKVWLGVSAYVWGIFPLYKASKWGSSFSLQDTFYALWQCLNELPERCVESIKSSAIKKLVGVFAESMRRSKDAALSRIEKRYNALHQKFIARVIKKSRDDFRKALLENLGKSAGQVFAGIVEKHLATLLMKLKDEFSKANSKDGATMNTGEIALPNGTRFLFRRGKLSVFVLEQVPQLRTINFRGKLFQLSFPFVVFVVTLENNAFMTLQVFFRNEALKKKTDPLFCPAMPNVRSDFSLCFPAPAQQKDLGGIIEDAIQNFWGSSFNNDLRGFFESAGQRIPQIHSFEVWQENSRRGGTQFALSLNWESADMTLEEAVSRQIEYFSESSESSEPTVESTTTYVKNLGASVSQAVQESCFFLVPNVAIDENSLQAAQKQLKELLDQSYNELTQEVDKRVNTTASKKVIFEAVKEGIRKAAEGTQTEGRAAINIVTQIIDEHQF